MTRKQREYAKFAVSRLGGVVVDFVCLLAAYFSAVLLRFDLHPPRWGYRTMLSAFVSVAVAHFLMLFLCGAYRLSWRRTELKDLPRYFLATFLACFLLVALRFFLPVESYAHIRPPYSVLLIGFFLFSFALVAWRIIWSWLWAAWFKERGLIRRTARHMDASAVRDFFAGKTVMITGAGGSIGSELARQVVALSPVRVLLVERGENALYEIDRLLRAQGASPEIVPLMKDVNDRAAMAEIFRRHRPEIVLHAAAYKHVPMVEMNPEEGWRNNTRATETLADLAVEFRVQRFVLISTDKAVRPVSVMGQTKRAAERAILSKDGATSFCAVRFGNVLNSSGSVVPLFREQIEARRPVTITHVDMRRYFMTVDEAVSLVLQAASRSERAIYTLDMGRSVRIVDLAERMIRQAGYRPYVDIPLVVTGIRPGEKLFEELDISRAEKFYKTDMAKIYITRSED